MSSVTMRYIMTQHFLFPLVDVFSFKRAPMFHKTS